MHIVSITELENLVKSAVDKHSEEKIEFSDEIKVSKNGNKYHSVKFNGWPKQIQNSIEEVVGFYTKDDGIRIAELLIRRYKTDLLPQLTAFEEFELAHLERIFLERQKGFEARLAVGVK